MLDAMNATMMYGYLRKLTRNNCRAKNKELQKLKDLVKRKGDASEYEFPDLASESSGSEASEMPPDEDADTLSSLLDTGNDVAWIGLIGPSDLSALRTEHVDSEATPNILAARLRPDRLFEEA
eukprot:15462074-Alexandrium_andersonii.AAC.1